MTTPIHLALVVDAPHVPRRAVAEIAAALQRQLIRDVAPIWEVWATVDAFPSLDLVPPGYWPILVGDYFPGNELIGVHLDRSGQPFALVEASPSWSFAASHEAIEMVIDPWGNRTVPGGSPMAGQGLVEILVEICDPPGDPQWGYTVNGYLVSDFVTPNYYDPVGAPGVRYSFMGVVPGPREVLRGRLPLMARSRDKRVVAGRADLAPGAHDQPHRTARRGRPADPRADRPVLAR